MKLSRFIIENLDDIIDEWEQFASTIPGAGAMDKAALQDHVKAVLETIAREMDENPAQEGIEQERAFYQSVAKTPDDKPGARHATERLSHGFSVEQLMAEFQALRLSVMRRWAASVDVADKAMLEQLVSFNKGIDITVMASVSRYTNELNTAREIFLGIIGHDLRSPLTAMKMSASMIENDHDTPPKQRRLAVRIGQSGQRVERMLNDLMDMARARMGGSMPLTRRRTDLHEVAEDVLAELKAADAGVVVKARFDGDLTGCWDSERLIQLLMNLMSNAIKHGAANRPISLHAFEADDAVYLEVHNEGAPVPEPIKRSIFEPFVMGRRPERFSVSQAGVGLGCTSAKSSSRRIQE